jgi:uncharacterized protein YdeI (BOF family)
MKSLVGLLILMISLTGVFAIAQDQPQAQPQTEPSASPTASPSQSPSAADQASQSQMGQQQSQTFEGKISKENGSLVLKDKATNTSYKLDNEEQARQFEGKDVKVTGTLDPATNTVHVTNIEIASKQ